MSPNLNFPIQVRPSSTKKNRTCRSQLTRFQITQTGRKSIERPPKKGQGVKCLCDGDEMIKSLQNICREKKTKTIPNQRRRFKSFRRHAGRGAHTQVGDATGAEAHWCCATTGSESTSVKHGTREGKTNTLIRNTVQHQQPHNHQHGELCGDLLRTEGSSSLKSTRAGSTGETRGKPIKRRASKLQKKNGAYIRQSPPTVYLNQPESRENEADRPGALSLSFSFSRRFEKDTYSTTPLSPFFAWDGPSFMAVVQQRQQSSRRKKIEYIAARWNSQFLFYFILFRFSFPHCRRRMGSRSDDVNKQREQQQTENDSDLIADKIPKCPASVASWLEASREDKKGRTTRDAIWRAIQMGYQGRKGDSTNNTRNDPMYVWR